MSLSLFKSIDLKSAKKNQNVTLNLKSDKLVVTTSQNYSTPGCMLFDSSLDEGKYTFSCISQSDTPNKAHLAVWIGKEKVGKSIYFTPTPQELSVDFELDKTNHVRLALLMHSIDKNTKVTSNIHEAHIYVHSQITEGDVEETIAAIQTEENVEPIVKLYNIEEPQIEKVVVEEAIEEEINIKGDTQSELFVYSKNSAFGHGSFIRNLQSIYNVSILDSDEKVKTANQDNRHILFNGFTSEIESLISNLKNKKNVHVIWHSMFRGSELMGEVSRLHRLFSFKSKNPINCYLVSPIETLPKGWQRFPLPLIVDESSKFNTSYQVDFALPLGSAHSNICKNLTDTAIKALSLDCSFTITEDILKYLSISVLKQAFGSTSSKYKVYNGTHQPIENSYYKSAAVYALPSLSDSMPYTLIESINAGTPALMTKDVGWASVFTITQHVPKFVFDNIEDLLLQAKTLASNLHARKALWQYQKRILIETVSNRKRLLKTTFPQIEQVSQVEEKVIELDIARYLENSNRILNENPECHHLIGVRLASELKENRLALKVKLSNVATESSIDIKETLSSSRFIEVVRQQNYWEVLNLIFNISKDHKLTLDTDPLLSKEFDLLVIDQFGWAFNNISNEILKFQKSDSLTLKITIPEMVILEKFSPECFKNVRVVVAFWYFTSEQIKKMCPNAKLLTALYDHYSWQIHPQELRKAISCSDAFGFGNAKLKSEVLKSSVDKDFDFSNTLTYILKDGVCPDKFATLNSSNSDNTFTFGWIGKATQATDFNSSIKDLKGVKVIEEAFNLFKESSDIKNVHLHLYNANEQPCIPHEEVRDSFYAKIDCLICASESEGTPNTIFEALSCGVPILSTDVGNVSDVLIESVNGFGFERTAESLANAMKLAYNTTWNRHMISESVTEFHWENKSKVWNLILESLRN